MNTPEERIHTIAPKRERPDDLNIRELIQRHDWAKTSLGAISTWDSALTVAVNLCLNTKFPAVLLWGRDLIQICNDAYFEVSRTREQLVGTPAKAAPHDLCLKSENILNKVFHNGESVMIENHPVILAGEKKERYFTSSYSAVYTSKGIIGGVFILIQESTHAVRDSTESIIERNNELAGGEKLYHKMIDEVQDFAIILLDRNGVIQNWNMGAEKIKLYKENEIVGKHFSIFYLPDDLDSGLPGRLINIASTNGRATHEGWRMRKDGSKFWGSVAITALHNDTGEIIGFSKVTRDLTERKLAEDKMKAYTLELEAQNTELEQFAYVASHDLQEPLRKIQTFCEVIQKNGHDPETSKKYFPRIISAAQRMADLIKSVLNYSRLSKDKQSFVPVDLNAIVANILNDFEIMITEKKASIQYERLPIISGIPLQIGQLFTNLISNALKFSIKDPIIKISSRVATGNELVDFPLLSQLQKYAVISVTDNGIGFDQKYEKLIFAMFQRLNSKHEYAGTGIGLALCKKIIENHRGHITAQSEPGKGSTFTVYLPME